MGLFDLGSGALDAAHYRRTLFPVNGRNGDCAKIKDRLIPDAPVLPNVMTYLLALGRDDGFHFPHRCRFPYLQFLLPMQGGLSGVNSGLLIGLLDEVTPALVTIGRVLACFEFLQLCFSELPAFDHFDHSGGAVRPNVMPDDGVGRREVVACQKESISFPCRAPIQG